jgi:hypothetical protein
VAGKVLVSVRRGKRVVVQRRVKVRRGGSAHLRLKARRRGVYRVTAVDPGPPARTARAKRRVR